MESAAVSVHLTISGQRTIMPAMTFSDAAFLTLNITYMAIILRKPFRMIILAGLIFLNFTTTTYALVTGNQAPDFDLQGEKRSVKLSDKKGSVVYVNFWASWCTPCRESFPWMNTIQEKYRAQGLKIIGINLDGKHENAKKFLAQIPAKFTIAFDSDGLTPMNYELKGMPTGFLIDRHGRIISEHLGFNAADCATIEQQIKTALKSRK
jgi:thiol-disulfide isomerase/thioredoxin